ncbi:MAG: glutaredoxin domain-containing protein [Candidatus Altiarchaeota archaeon]|nr:glutaredoxin domain-containing protein [Candidatus Altiarchaeota archaeon]
MAKVKLYSTPTCPYCKMTRDYLTGKGIEFEDINVAADQKAASEMMEKSGQMSVPVIELNSKIIVGFDKAALDKEIKNV